MPEYGPERMGAPIKAFTRISPEPIDIHCNIENPDIVIVLDDSLIDVADVAEGLVADGAVMVNTCTPPDAIKRDISDMDSWTAEHSAMSACIGASAAGPRIMTATASQGLALMWEELYMRRGLSATGRTSPRRPRRPARWTAPRSSTFWRPALAAGEVRTTSRSSMRSSVYRRATGRCSRWRTGTGRMTVKVRDRKPIEEFLKPQGSFCHLLKPENAALLAEVQADVDAYWEYITKRCAG